MTECQQKAYEATRKRLIGAFNPKCNEDGTYARVQCWGSTGYCWCASEDGTEWPGTRVRGQPKCDVNDGTCYQLFIYLLRSTESWQGHTITVHGANRPFYRYGGHIELIRFKGYYRMPRGHGAFECFSGHFFLKFSENTIVMGKKILVPCLDVIMIAFF